MPDKLPKDMTMAERRAEYSQHRHAPTTDREASRLIRVIWLYREMPRIKPKSVLDIGCESGFITRWLVDEPYLGDPAKPTPDTILFHHNGLVGIDPCEFSIEHAKKMVKKRSNPKKAWYSVMGWEELAAPKQVEGGRMPLPTDSLFDTIVCFEVIEHFLPEEGKQLIAKIHEMLAPRGTAFLCTPSAEGVFGNSNPDPYHLKIYTREELAKLVEEVTGVKPEANNTDPAFIMLKWRKPSA